MLVPILHSGRRSRRRSKKGTRRLLKGPYPWTAVILMACIFITLRIFMIPAGSGNVRVPPNPPSYLEAQAIGQAMGRYSSAHDGAFPSGSSSTEIFQKLIDGHYLTDPGILFDPYLGVPGKVKATSNTLRPENVCWDVTTPTDRLTSDALPFVFETGFRLEYAPGGNAVPLSPALKKRHSGFTVLYLGLTTGFFRGDLRTDGVVAEVVPARFDPGGKTYVQLTPDGPLP